MMIAISGLRLPDLRFRAFSRRVAGVFAPLCAAILLSSTAFAADISIDTASFTSPSGKLTFQKIDVVGSSLSEAQLRALFGATDAAKAADTLAMLNAQSVKIGTVISEASEGTSRFTLTTNGLELSNITGGKIASAKAQGGTVKTEVVGEKAGTGTFGKVTFNDADLVAILRVQLPTPNAAGPLLPLYSDFSVEAISFKPPEGASLSVARLITRDGRARAVEEPIQAYLATAKTDFSTMNAQEKARFVKIVAAAYASNAIGSFELQDVGFADESNPDGNGKISRILYTGGAGIAQGRFAIEQLTAGSATEKVRIGSIAFSGWSLEPTMRALVLAYGNPATSKDPAPADVLPVFGKMEMRDFSVASSGAFKGNTSLQSLQVEIDNPKGGLPTGMHYSFDRFTSPVQETDEASRQLAALGYRDLDISGAVSLALREETGDLELKEGSFRGANMGNVRISAAFGNALELVKATKPEDAMLAMSAVTLKRLAITVENRGFFERYVENEARTKKKTPEQVRKEYASATAIGLPMFIGMSPAAKAITASVTRFINKPDRLTIAATAKDPNGFGVADYVGVSSPDDIFKSLDVVANNE